MNQDRGLYYLRMAMNRPGATFRDGQWESIAALLNHKRMMVVERTGWGKSMVYFLATKLLREQGAGPTLLISPLLSLMRNQLEAAARIGVNAATINCANWDEWEQIGVALRNNQIDILLISPERLANDDFLHEYLGGLIQRIGLLVIDEAHCISDWGHDFRPDYRRIVRIVNALPASIPILATTATANNRVVEDVQQQLGNIDVIRGTLVRKSLMLQNIKLPEPSERLAWMANIIPTLPSSGIVYTLTQRDAVMVSNWLNQNSIVALPYYSSVDIADQTLGAMAAWSRTTPENVLQMPEERRSNLYKEFLEQMLLGNRIKVLVATVALGMGFDKPDLGFVIHYQRPASVVHYYQQVGRAGRAVDTAYGILLHGQEDDRIADYFISSAFPPQKHVGAILAVLKTAPSGLSTVQIQKAANLRPGQVDKALRYLATEYPPPVIKRRTAWFSTPDADNYLLDMQRVREITQLRHDEQKQMTDYMNCKTCLMAFLQQALDDPNPEPCGQCVRCTPEKLFSEEVDPELKKQAEIYLRGTFQIIEPRKQWPSKGILHRYPFSSKRFIAPELMMSEGRALATWLDGGWGQMITDGMYKTCRFDDQLVTACAEMVRKWDFGPDPPKWVTCVPSTRSKNLVPDFAERLANELQLPFKPRVRKVRDNHQQAVLTNSYQQVENLDGVFSIDITPAPPGRPYAPCLLVDDTVCTRWTLTLVSALIRSVGVRAVFPLALAMKMD